MELLKDYLTSFTDFYPMARSWGFWARENAEMPKNYRCFLGRFVPLEPDENRKLYPVITDHEALMIDRAFIETRLDPQIPPAQNLDYNLTMWAIVGGHDSLDIVTAGKYLSKLFRRHKMPFNCDTVDQRIRDILERVRLNLLDQFAGQK